MWHLAKLRYKICWIGYGSGAQFLYWWSSYLTLYSTLTSKSLGTFWLVFFCGTPKGALCIWMGQKRIEATCRNWLMVNCAVYMTTPWRGCVWSVKRESMRAHLFPCLHMTGHAGIFLVVAVSMGTSALLVCFLCKRSLSLRSRICRARSKTQNTEQPHRGNLR